MKYILLVGDGMADRPIEELGGKTPLEVARTPNMDFLAREGIVGKARTIPEGMPAGSTVATLSLLGYDPRVYLIGRGPLEAASRGIELRDGEIAFRCNLVTVGEKEMIDYSAGHISSEEALVLMEYIDDNLGGDDLHFYPGVSYRHLMITQGELSALECTPPHDIMGENFETHLPKGEGEEFIRHLLYKSKDLLAEHKINQERVKRGKNPANMIWAWEQGKKPVMPTLKDRYNISGAVISAVDLIRGIGYYAGLDIIEVPGATGYIDTNYEGKVEYALRLLDNNDFIFVHVEAPDEAGHAGDVDLKIETIEDFDTRLVGGILRGLEGKRDYKILLLPDHFTPLSIRTHSPEPVPFLIYSPDGEHNNVRTFSEKAAEEGDIYLEEGSKLIDNFIT